jgi:hypothetical protein
LPKYTKYGTHVPPPPTEREKRRPPPITEPALCWRCSPERCMSDVLTAFRSPRRPRVPPTPAAGISIIRTHAWPGYRLTQLEQNRHKRERPGRSAILIAKRGRGVEMSLGVLPLVTSWAGGLVPEIDLNKVRPLPHPPPPRVIGAVVVEMAPPAQHPEVRRPAVGLYSVDV